MLLRRLATGLWLMGLALVGPANAYDDPNVRSHPMRAHSLAPPYLDSDMHTRWFEYGGDTLIRTDKYLRLTSTYPSQQGWIFSRVPITATNWEIEVEFKIHGPGHLYGDGFAMWLTTQRGTNGPVFGSADKFEGLGIFFDTYKNNRPGVTFPYVMAMIGDGETLYDQEHDGKSNEIAGCSARGIRDSTVPTKARLTYFQEKSLTLDLMYKSDGSWTNCFTLTAPKDTFAIPSVAYLGFSAETGELSDNHDIISVASTNLYFPPGLSKPEDSGKQSGGYGSKPPEATTSGWGWFFFKVFLFFAVVSASYAGWTFYRGSRTYSRF